MGKLVFVLAAFLGITLTVSLTVGPYVVGVSQTPQGETKVYHGASVGSVEKGKSYCALGCQPDAKPESYESVDLNPNGDFVALGLNRTDGNVTTEYGVQSPFPPSMGSFV